MDKKEKERLVKAEQTAGLFASDLKEILDPHRQSCLGGDYGRGH